MTPRTTEGTSTTERVVTSPATTVRPVVTRVSIAARDPGSPLRTSSRIASEIWSAILSGCPSVTDSDVKRYRPLAMLAILLIAAARRNNRVPGFARKALLYKPLRPTVNANPKPRGSPETDGSLPEKALEGQGQVTTRRDLVGAGGPQRGAIRGRPRHLDEHRARPRALAQQVADPLRGARLEPLRHLQEHLAGPLLLGLPEVEEALG